MLSTPSESPKRFEKSKACSIVALAPDSVKSTPELELLETEVIVSSSFLATEPETTV